MDSKISVGGRTFLLKDADERFSERCYKRYAADDSAVGKEIVATEEDLQKTQEDFNRLTELLGEPAAEYPAAFLQNIVFQKKITDILLEDDVCLFHASALMVNGCGIAFTAQSGTGKSTHARLWREQSGYHISAPLKDAGVPFYIPKYAKRPPVAGFLCGRYLLRL